jgi:UDP-glucuronate 4-epimerase
MRTILVTGAAGFIGSHLTEHLLNRGDSVIGFDSFDPFYPRLVKEENIAAAQANARFTLVEGDICNPSVVEDTLARYRPTLIVHLAARAGVRPSIVDPAGYARTNVEGTVNLLHAVTRFPVGHFVFASSSSVYGDAAQVPFAEDDPTDRPESPYAATKKAGEALAFTYHRLLGIPVTCLRFFTVFGPRQRPDLAINKFVRLISAGEPVPFFGDGATSRDYTFVEDTVEGIVAAMDHPDGFQIYNLGRSNPVRLSDLVRSIEHAVNKEAVLNRLPVQQGDVQTTFANIDKARKRLGYAPKVELEEGIRRFVEWWRATQHPAPTD